jgi:membrane-associated phospholipid phosphatase
MHKFKLVINSLSPRILLVQLLLVTSLSLFAQENSDSVANITPLNNKTDTIPGYYYRVNGAYLKTYWQDFKHVAAAPVRWKGRQWGKFAAVVSATGLVMLTLDEPVQQMMMRNQKEAFKSASDVFYPLGNRFPPLLLSGMYLTSLITKNRRMEHASLSVAKSLAISTAFYTASKSIIRRQRPTRTEDPYDFVAPFSKKGYTSFPSGHTNTAFAVATAFALEYNDKKWVPWVAYSLATLTAVSRVYDNRHWFSDIIIGASVGHFVTKAIYRQEYKRRAAGKINVKGF